MNGLLELHTGGSPLCSGVVEPNLHTEHRKVLGEGLWMRAVACISPLFLQTANSQLGSRKELLGMETVKLEGGTRSTLFICVCLGGVLCLCLGEKTASPHVAGRWVQPTLNPAGEGGCCMYVWAPGCNRFCAPWKGPVDGWCRFLYLVLWWYARLVVGARKARHPAWMTAQLFSVHSTELVSCPFAAAAHACCRAPQDDGYMVQWCVWQRFVRGSGGQAAHEGPVVVSAKCWTAQLPPSLTIS